MGEYGMPPLPDTEDGLVPDVFSADVKRQCV